MGDQIINTRITADIAQAEQGIRTIKRDLKSLGDEARDLFSPLNLVKTALASLSAWSGIQGIRSLIDTALAMERLNTQFKVITESAILGAAEMRFVTAESKRLGQELTVLAAAYSRLMQATKGGVFEGAPTKAMFSGFSEAFTALKMTSDQMSGVWLQINQGMMKGKIQLEDVNIIAERGLNIIKLLEISTGKSSKELMAMIGKSELLSSEYMKLGPLLSQIYGGQAKTAAQELQGTINNFSTEFFKLKASIADNWTPAFTSSLKLITANMKEIVSTAVTLGTVLTAAFAGRSLGQFATTVAKNSAVMGSSVGTFTRGITGGISNTAAGSQGAAIAENAARTAAAQQVSTAATLVGAKALQSYEAASVSLAQAEVRRLTILESSGAVSAKDIGFKKQMAAATAELAAAEKGYAASKLSTIAAQEASTIADNANTAAKARQIAVTAEATFANRALAVATNAIVSGVNAVGVAFNAIGGWITVLIVAITAAVMWWNKYKEAEDNALKARPSATAELDIINEKIRLAQKEIDITKAAAGDKAAKARLGIALAKEEESIQQKQLNAYGAAQKALGEERAKINPNAAAVAILKANEDAAYAAIDKIKPAQDQLKTLMSEVEKNRKKDTAKTTADPNLAFQSQMRKEMVRASDEADRFDQRITSIKESYLKLNQEGKASALSTSMKDAAISAVQAEQAIERLKVAKSEYHKFELASDKEKLATAENNRNEELAKVKSLHAQFILSDRQLLDEEVRINKTAAASKVDELTKELAESTKLKKEAEGKLGTITNGTFDATKVQAEDVKKYYSAVAEEQRKEAALNKAISDQKIVGINSEEKGAVFVTTQMKGQLALAQELAGIRSANDTLAASMVGTNAAGGFDSATDQLANELAMQQQAYDNEMRLIDEKIVAYETEMKTKKYMEESYTDFIIEQQKKRALLEGKTTQAGVASTEKATKSNLSMVAQYTGMAGQFFTALASTQDQSSRKGFETAKAFSLAAAVMSTAAAVMNALATVPYPMSIAAAVLAAATGAIQIATIASTSFGGGAGNVSAPSGSFASASGGGSDSGLSNLAVPLSSVQDSQTTESLAALTKSTDNASVVIGRLSKSIDSLNALFKDGGAGMELSTNAPMKYTAVYEKPALTFGNVIGIIGTALFGGSWGVSGAGLSLGVNSGNVTAQDYLSEHKSGGLFGKSKDRTTYASDPDAQNYIQSMLNPYISDITRMAMTLGTTANMGGANMPSSNIATAGRSAEDIAKDVQAWSLEVLQSMSMTVDGLKDVVGSYDDAYARLKALNDALVSTNDSFLLIGKTTIQGTLTNARAVEALQALMGGMDKFTTAVNDYFTGMFTSAQQDAMTAASDSQKVNTAFGEMRAFVPGTKADFIALANSLDVTSASGAMLFAALMQISPAFSEMTDLVEKQRQATADFNNDLISRTMKLDGVNGDLFNLRIAQEDEMKKAVLDGMDTNALAIVQTREWANAVNTASGVITASITSIRDAAKTAAISMVDAQIAILNLMKTIQTGPLANMSPEAAYKQALTTFNDVKGKTDLASVQALPVAVTALLDASKNYSSDKQAYMSDVAKGLTALALASGASGSDLPAIESQLEVLQDIRTSLNEGALVEALGAGGTLAQLLGVFNTATAATLAETAKQDAIKQSRDAAAVYNASQSSLSSQYTYGSVTPTQYTDQTTAAYTSAKTKYDTAIATPGVSVTDLIGLNNPTITTAMSDARGAVAQAATDAAAQATAARQAQGRTAMDANAATLFVDDNYRGGSVTLAARSYNNTASMNFSNDVLSSIKVAPGYKATMYWDDNLSGNSLGFTGDNPGVGHWANDEMSSMKIERVDPYPAFATGGDHYGGFRIVGENGPELEATGASRIFNADQTRNIFQNGSADNRDMVAELRALREEVRELRNEQKAGHVAIAKNTGESAKQLRRWDGEGTPPVRAAA